MTDKQGTMEDEEGHTSLKLYHYLVMYKMFFGYNVITIIRRSTSQNSVYI